MISNIIDQMLSREGAFVLTHQHGSHKAWLAARLFGQLNRNLLVVVPDSGQADTLVNDLQFFMTDRKNQVLFLPGYDVLPFKSLSHHRQTSLRRMAVMSRLTASLPVPHLVVTGIDTLLWKLVPQTRLNGYADLIMTDEETDRDALILKLESGGYHRVSLVEDPGEYSVRGDILDLFVPGWPRPVRMEFFGDLVESIRSFSPYTQRGIRELSEVAVMPATEAVITNQDQPHVLARLRSHAKAAGLDDAKIREYVTQVRETGRIAGIEAMLSIVYDNLDTVFDYLPDDTCVIWDSPGLLAEKAQAFEQRVRQNYQTMTAEKRLGGNPDQCLVLFDQAEALARKSPHLVLNDLPFTEPETDVAAVSLPIKSIDILPVALEMKNRSDIPLKPLVDWIEHRVTEGGRIVCVLHQNAQVQRLVSLLAPYGLIPFPLKTIHDAHGHSAGLYTILGDLSSGFVMTDQNLVLITEEEIFGKKRMRRIMRASRDLKTEMIAPEELENGDIVVHAEHGVGRYDGLVSLDVGKISQDFIKIIYQDDDTLYLPVDRMEMIGKYIGVDGHAPVLDKIGSKAWVKSKAKARKEVEKMAADLLDLYAKRRINKGFAFSRPDRYYQDFETTFPYEETPDQLKAIDEVHLDMESDTPMDRLVCGDVGYGKTEVAIRAAFKAVTDGKQVAVVVPTTILTEQHLATFRDRFGNYPVNIAGLSRFRSRREQNDILAQMADGRMDIVIGTHRLLQKDVVFKSLGLLVIDEEQRFGVRHKEVLKKKRSTVDVLALSATPIPRTLHLSLTGMRDISVIKTPPADRQPIVSYITPYEEGVVKDAVQKELARNGQVFFVHNRIKTIVKLADNLKKLVPEARIGVAHGRLSETELERVMMQFVKNEIDLLVCTTIIESGLDIPSANTMIIDRAERFGLAQIYQLRGRIGRGDHQAYAYLLVSDESQISKDARKRLAALMEYRDLGSGFQIAMKDLQIRGAGTTLGASQSGHIAAVGYDLFLKLLDQAVHDLKGDTHVEPLDPEINAGMSTGFPEDYIESVSQRLTLYRRLSRLTTLSEISDIKKELKDRYGRLPRPAENMLLKIMLRVLAIQCGVKRLDLDPANLVLTFSLPHLTLPLPELEKKWLQEARFKWLKKDCVQFHLGFKANQTSKALVKTKQILSTMT
ncbi:MAG: transcription-repair coupling factor [Desulfotignum sp.]|nr:transcription-repair coupling factor [Desulfotignum sp.]